MNQPRKTQLQWLAGNPPEEEDATVQGATTACADSVQELADTGDKGAQVFVLRKATGDGAKWEIKIPAGGFRLMRKTKTRSAWARGFF